MKMGLILQKKQRFHSQVGLTTKSAGVNTVAYDYDSIYARSSKWQWPKNKNLPWTKPQGNLQRGWHSMDNRNRKCIWNYVPVLDRTWRVSQLAGLETPSKRLWSFITPQTSVTFQTAIRFIIFSTNPFDHFDSQWIYFLGRLTNLLLLKNFPCLYTAIFLFD